jgi:ABC-type multidrug transport system ATPase subunit
VVMRGRTTIAIAHRLSTIQDMDTILVLHHGELRERGSHAELLAQKGIYHRLYELQFNAGRNAAAATQNPAFATVDVRPDASSERTLADVELPDAVPGS